MKSNGLKMMDQLLLKAKEHLSIIKENQYLPLRCYWVGESSYTEVPFKSNFDIDKIESELFQNDQ